MDTDSILCKLFKIHNYTEILNDKKYLISKCSCCDKYKIIHKYYEVKSIYNQEELPDNFKDILS